MNLPYAFDYVRDDKRVMLDSEQRPLRLLDFLDAAADTANTAESIVDAASLYVEPPRHHVVVEQYDGQLVDITKKLGGLTFTIFRDGVLEGRDRSNTMMRLMYHCRDDGLTPTESLALLDDFDQRHGKFVGRPDRDEQLLRMVTKVYEK